MIFPFSDHNPTKRVAVATYAIVALNVIALLWANHRPLVDQYRVVYEFGFVPARIAQFQNGRALRLDLHNELKGDPQLEHVRGPIIVQLPPDRAEIATTLLTTMFMHGGWLHLMSNMWFLIIFGNNIEDRLGHVVYTLFYLVGGLVASACHWWSDPDSLVPVIGASGAVAAVLGAYAVTFPKARVRSLVFLGIFITVMDLPALLVLGLWFGIQLLNAGVALGGGLVGGVAWWAHVGGFLAGCALMPLLGGWAPPTATDDGFDMDQDRWDDF